MNNITKKIVASITILTCAVWMIGPGVASATTAEELQEQIDTLLASLATLQTQLETLEGTAEEDEEAEEAVTIEGVPADFTFETNLKLTSTGDDVKYLQIVLNSDSDTQLAESGVGSPGEETSYFGPLTKAAVIKFQELYTEDCLAFWELTEGTGYVGSTTLAKLNSLLAAAEEEEEAVCSVITNAVECVTANCSWDAVTEVCSGVEEEEEEEEAVCSVITDAVECVTAGCSWDATTDACFGVVEEEEEVTGELNVALAADTPAAQLVPSGISNGAAASNVAFTKVTFSGSGEVSKIVVTRGGVSTDATLTGVKLYDGDTQIGITQTFNAVHQAVFSLTTPWEVSGTKTLTIAGDYTVAEYGQVILSIQSASDITADVTVGGTFPIVGNPVSGSAVNVGGLTVDNGSLQPITGGTVDVDATNTIFMQMRLTAGAVEDVYVNTVTVARGTLATFIDSDITNITLYNDTTGTEIGKVTALGVDSKATFSLVTPLSIERGRFVEMSVRADVLGGSNRRIAFDINDGLAYTINATGKSYGYGVAVAEGTFAGIGAPYTAVNQGILNVSRGTNCPATGNIAVGGSDIELGSFNLRARGEDIRIARTIISVIGDVNSVNIAAELTMFKLVDSDGNVLAGPVNVNGIEAALDTVSFTTQITLSPGDNEIFVVANTATTVPNGSTYQVGFAISTVNYAGGGGNPSTAIVNARGMTSNLTIDAAPAADVLGNVMTAVRGALTANMAATPVSGNVIIGGQAVTLANLRLNATASGEDIRITQIVLTKTGSEDYALGTLSDIELWDGTTQVGLSMQPTTNVITFTLTTPYVVSRGVSKTLAVKANLVGGTATNDHIWAVAAPTCLTVTGAPVVVTAPGTGSEAQTLQETGDLRVTIDASPVTSAQLVANTTNNEVIRYKFWAYDEDVEVSRIYVWVGNNDRDGTMPDTASADIASVSIWLGATQISGDVPITSDESALVGLPAGALIVPKNGTKVVTLKVNFNDKTSLASGVDFQFGIADDGEGVSADMDDTCWSDDAAAVNAYAITATGSASGLPLDDIDSVQGDLDVDATGQVFGSNAMEVFDGKLVVALNSASPSGTQTPGANKEVIRIDLTAVGDDITVTALTLTTGATYEFDNSSDSVYLQNVAGTVTYDCSLCSGAVDCAAVGDDSFDTGSTIVFPADEATGPCTTAGAVWENALVIAEGTTTSIKVVGDTSGSPTVGQSLQLSILDALTDLTWTDVSGNGPSAVGTQVIPLYGNTLRY